jgi:hypothetical protein
MDLIHIGAGPFKAPVPCKINKHLHSEHDVPPPPFSGLIRLSIPNAILFHKARSQIFRKTIAEPPLARELDEVFPDYSISGQ